MCLVGCIAFKAEGSAWEGAFELVREEAESFGEKGLAHQFWGRAIEAPHPGYWFLVWESGDPDSIKPIVDSLAVRLHDCRVVDMLPESFVVVVHQSPVLTFRAPATSTALFLPVVEKEGQARDTMSRSHEKFLELNAEGFCGWVTSTPVGGRWGLYITGWESVEHHQNGLAIQSEEGDRYREAATDTLETFEALRLFHVKYQEHVARKL